MLRQRVREVDEDRRTGRVFDRQNILMSLRCVTHANRFVHKHGGKSPNTKNAAENIADNFTVRDSFEALSGVNGLSNAIVSSLHKHRG